MEAIKIIQHNVLHWTTRKFHLTNIYLEINPDIILRNSHGLKEKNIKIPGYNSYNKNINEISDGITILVKNNIKYTIKDESITNFLEIIIDTSLGKYQLQPPTCPQEHNIYHSQMFIDWHTTITPPIF